MLTKHSRPKIFILCVYTPLEVDMTKIHHIYYMLLWFSCCWLF